MRKLVLLVISLLLIVLSVVVSQAQEFGTNWTAVFYNNRTFADPSVATVTGINGLNFNWPNVPRINNQPVQGVREDRYSVRFTSTQNFTTPGTYRFDLTWDDQVRVIIDGQTVFENFSLDGVYPKTGSFERAMNAGPHTFTVELVEQEGGAVIQFQWRLAGAVTPGPGTVFPTPTPLPTEIPPLTASLVSVRGLAVRTGPYLGATMITTAVTGQAYPVLARNPSEPGVTWYKITVNGRTGWSSGRFLTFNTPPDGLVTEGSVFDTLDNPPETGVIAAPRSIMNLRVRPSTRTAIIGSVPWGAEVPLLGRTVQGGFDRWYQVRYNDQVGWIFAAFVTVRGDIRQVPIH